MDMHAHNQIYASFDSPHPKTCTTHAREGIRLTAIPREMRRLWRFRVSARRLPRKSTIDFASKRSKIWKRFARPTSSYVFRDSSKRPSIISSAESSCTADEEEIICWAGRSRLQESFADISKARPSASRTLAACGG